MSLSEHPFPLLGAYVGLGEVPAVARAITDRLDSLANSRAKVEEMPDNQDVLANIGNEEESLHGALTRFGNAK